MSHKSRDRLDDYYRDHGILFGISFLCFIYFMVYHFLESDWVARIFPPLHLAFFILSYLFMFGYQFFTWKRLKLFEDGGLYDLWGWTLFICEYVIMCFVMSLCLWPFYAVFIFFRYLLRLP